MTFVIPMFWIGFVVGGLVCFVLLAGLATLNPSRRRKRE